MPTTKGYRYWMHLGAGELASTACVATCKPSPVSERTGFERV
jgi:hypothetical protein